MRKIIPIIAVLLTLLAFLSSAHACKYSVRDVGFVETGLRPYRLVVMHDAGTAAAAKQLRTSLQKDLLHSNIVLISVPADQRKAFPEVARIEAPESFTKPLCWLLAPDERVVPFDPAAGRRGWLESPLRKQLLDEMPLALCTLLLLESTDDAANEKAKSKAQAVIEQIEKVNKKLEKAPPGKVKLLTLTRADRPAERWTLWSLGEDVTPPEKPKLAVVFGNLRRAGAVLEGTQWNNEALFSRIATLGESCECSLDRQRFFGPPILHRAPGDWNDVLTKALDFNPQSEAIKAEMQAILDKEPQPAEKRKARRLTFEELMSGFKIQDVNEDDPEKRDPLIPDPPKMLEPEINNNVEVKLPEERDIEVLPAFVRWIILIAGVVGWLLLTASAFVLDRGQPPPAAS